MSYFTNVYFSTAEYYSDGHCKLCHSTCETCQGGTESSCLTCAPPLLLQNGSCVATCGTGAYQEAGICAPCLHACTACVSRLNCTACAPGLRLQSGECRASCAPGYYSDRGLCSKCYLSCQTCRFVFFIYIQFSMNFYHMFNIFCTF